jgi:hypothetical protein
MLIIFNVNNICYFACVMYTSEVVLLEDNSNIRGLAFVCVSYPGKGECADPVYEDAILERVGGESPGWNKKRQLASDTGGGKT